MAQDPRAALINQANPDAIARLIQKIKELERRIVILERK